MFSVRSKGREDQDRFSLFFEFINSKNVVVLGTTTPKKTFNSLILSESSSKTMFLNF